MSVVEIKCPRCGSACSQEGSSPNEYVCSHCGSVFRFADGSKRTVARDVVIRGCLYCGKALEAGRGFRCTRCGREYFCESCVDLAMDKYVCFECISKANENCQLCKKYAVYKCVSCGRRACKTHHHDMGFSTPETYSRGARVFYCPNCRGAVCTICVKHALISGAQCPRCKAKLVEYAPYK